VIGYMRYVDLDSKQCRLRVSHGASDVKAVYTCPNASVRMAIQSVEPSTFTGKWLPGDVFEIHFITGN